MRFINIEFDSWTTMTFMTKNTDEEIQAVMTKFEDTEGFISDEYPYEDFVSFAYENGIDLTETEEGETVLYFDRNKQNPQ